VPSLSHIKALWKAKVLDKTQYDSPPPIWCVFAVFSPQVDTCQPSHTLSVIVRLPCLVLPPPPPPLSPNHLPLAASHDASPVLTLISAAIPPPTISLSCRAAAPAALGL